MLLSSDQFALLRLSNPVAAFNTLLKTFSRAIEDDCEIAAAFAAFQKHVGRKFSLSVDARKLDAVKAQGADKLGINVGTLPMATSAGLAFMYDVAVEALRKSDARINPQMINSRGIHTAGRLFDSFLSEAGSLSVAALELALRDDRYAMHLRQRAGELTEAGKLGTDSNLAPPNPTNPCEFCVIEVKDKLGQVIEIRCPSEEECNLIGGIIIVTIIILILAKIVDWLF